MQNHPNKPAAVYKKDQERTKIGIANLFWLAVIVVMTFIIFVFLSLFPVFNNTNQPTSTSSEQPVIPVMDDDKKMEFEFYEVLPKQNFQSISEGISIQNQPAVQPNLPTTTDAVVQLKSDNTLKTEQNSSENDLTASSTSTYILQIRSYTDAADADNKRAEMLLAGVDAIVIRRNNENEESVYQVISKPFADKKAAIEAAGRLDSIGVNSLIIEQKH